MKRFAGSESSVLKQHYEKKVLELEHEKKALQVSFDYYLWNCLLRIHFSESLHVNRKKLRT